MRGTLLDRLVDKFTIGDGCWEWTASKNWGGYGTISEGGRAGRDLLAHRALYELMVGPIPEGLQIDHLCRNRGCVRPDHMEPVTQQENIRRGMASGSRGRQTHCANGHEFTEENIRRTGPEGRYRVCRACQKEWQGQYRERKALQ
jgi:hypothetical protein